MVKQEEIKELEYDDETVQLAIEIVIEQNLEVFKELEKL